MVNEVVLTQEGYRKLEHELKELQEKKRPAVIARIQEAKVLGDLAENADYQSAREEQSFIEGRIQELEDKLKRAQIVSERLASDRIDLGSRVRTKIRDQVFDFVIVGIGEGDPQTGKISSDSPLGEALLGRKAGDEVSVVTPTGKTHYKILSVK